MLAAYGSANGGLTEFPVGAEPAVPEGELWLDSASHLAVRESGRMVKSPSVFVKRIEFVREYEIQGDLAVPRRIMTSVDTRLVGKAMKASWHQRAMEVVRMEYSKRPASADPQNRHTAKAAAEYGDTISFRF